MEAVLSSEFVNDNPGISTSTINRGREIVDFAKVSNITNQEILDAHVMRIAIEATQAYRYLDFTTLLMPGHGSGDTLFINIPELFETPMMFAETSWTMELKPGGMMKHKANVVVSLE
jgi:hypothetical protein